MTHKRFRLREARPSDLKALTTLRMRSISALAASVYGEAQIEAWLSAARSPANTARIFDGRFVTVAVDDADSPLAFADLEQDGHIDMLYAAPEASGQGVAAAVMDEIEREARQRDLPLLFTEASERARPFLERLGFIVVKRRDVAIGDVTIHNYAMTKRLAA